MSEELYDLPEDLATQSVIQNRYSFWCHKRGKQTATNYEEAMKQVGNFQTIEHFWRIYNHLLRPSDFKTTTDFHLFKHGIKPTWEDPQNERGGKWMVRLKKGLATRYWEELIIAIIGEQFDVGHEICGAVVSVRNNEDIISVWNKNAENTEAKNKIRDQMRRILKLPAFINVEYKKHQDSIVDKSSFRNTVVWRSESSQDRAGRKPRADWSDRNDQNSGNDRATHSNRPHPNKDVAAAGNDHSPRGGTGTGTGFSPRFGGDKDKDKEKGNWQQAAGNITTAPNWKSPRSNYQAKDGASSSATSASPRNTSAWSTVGSGGNKPSPASTPSASSGGSSWFRGDASKADGGVSEKNTDSVYVALGGSKNQTASTQGRAADGEQRKRGGSGGQENVWGRVKKEAE